MARGFFAEIQHQARVAERERLRQARAEERAWKAATREAERARKAAVRAMAQHERATAAEEKRLAKEAKEAHVAAELAEVEERNLELASIYEEIDSLLAATLDVDDFVDLNTLKTQAVHAPFDRADLEAPIPPPTTIADPPQPILVPPLPPKGLRALFGKKKHEKETHQATELHESAMAHWKAKLVELDSLRRAAGEEHAALERERLVQLNAERVRYAQQCEKREATAAEHNAAIDQLIADLGYGTVEAVQEYISIVLSNSAYPPQFSVEHDFTFDPSTAELKLRVAVPRPDTVPRIKLYKYTKSKDEITSTALSQKACKDRYANAVNEVALRSLHEVFEADRRGLIATITLEVGTETTDPATGLDTFISFVAVGGERESFLKLNLAGIVPQATLVHLGASVSKNPFGLVAANTKGVRRS